MYHETKLSIHSICRVCLKQLKSEAAYDLFCVPGLVKKFCICTSLSVEPQDGYPKNICGLCHKRLNELHDFQKQCVDSVQKFQEMVAANTFSVDLIESVANEQNLTQEDDDDRLNFDPLLDHKLELVENEEDVFKMLEQESKDEDDVVEKENKNQSNLFDEKNFYSSESSISEPENDEDYFGAAAADDTQTSESDDDDDDKPLAMRMRKAKKRKIKDEPCSNDEKNSKLVKAIKPKRKRIPAAERHLHRIIECHICHQKFKKNINYQEHMKYHNDKLPHQCTIETCRKGFTTENALRIHVEHCHVETLETLPCPEEGCERRFPRTRQLHWHLKKVHNLDIDTRNFPCTECEKVFRCPMALKKHMFKHDGKELPFPCNICGKRFVINSELKFHLMRHAGIKNFVCPYCGVGKTTRQELNTHLATHTQEKKYKCDYCDRTSTNKQAMRNHVKIVHEKIKDYACQYCGKTFGKSNACKMHELTHTGDLPHKCAICGKGFLYAKGLTIHIKTHEKREKRQVEASSIKVKRKNKKNTEGNTSVDEEKPPLATLTEFPTPEISRNEEPFDSKEATVVVQQQQHPLHSIMFSDPPPPVVRKNPRHVERVDISQLAGTVVNPIPSVAVSSWSPQDSSTLMKEFPHTCPECGQGFNGLGNLKRHHRIVHERIKDFACRFCERRFAKAETLKHHEMTHTGEKPHECPDCGNRFIQYVTLKRHMKVHLQRPDWTPNVKKGRTKRPKTARRSPPSSPLNTASAIAAREELEVQERKKLDAKREAEEKRQAIAEAAKEQLSIMQQQQAELEKTQ